MKTVKTLVLRAAGSNCDMETAHAFSLAGSEADRVHVNRLLSGGVRLSDYDILALPGGFTYGDDISSGKVLANELKAHLREDMLRFIDDGKLIIGICNGFQVLVKMGLLPNTRGGGEPDIEATLASNEKGVFTDRWVYLKSSADQPGGSRCVWTNYFPEVSFLPVAHGEGRFVVRDDDVLLRLRENGQVVFRYCDEKGRPGLFPVNPNGSVDDIAGICDTTGRVLGMMPHPERHVSFLQHPHWRRRSIASDDATPGLMLFRNGVEYVKNILQRT